MTKIKITPESGDDSRSQDQILKRLISYEMGLSQHTLWINNFELLFTDFRKITNDRIERLENNFPVEQSQLQSVNPLHDTDVLAIVLEQLNNIKQRYGKDDGLSPEAFGVLLLRIEKLEGQIKEINNNKFRESLAKQIDDSIVDESENKDYRDYKKHEYKSEWCTFCEAPILNGWHPRYGCANDQRYNEMMRAAIDKKSSDADYLLLLLKSLEHEMKVLRDFYAQFGHRLKNVEDTFIGNNDLSKNVHDRHWLILEFEKFEDRLKKVEGYMELEDRITASDVLIRLNKCEAITDNLGETIDRSTKFAIDNLNARINELENGAIKRIGILGNALNDVSNGVYRDYKTPHKCPICEGRRHCSDKNSGLSWQCESCEGKGILWG